MTWPDIIIIISLFLSCAHSSEPCLLDHVRHRDFGVLLKHAGHQAVASDIVNALKERAEIIDPVQTWATPGPSNLGTTSPTWLISLVHAAFSWRDGAKRTTENGGPSGGSTTILNSKWLKPWPAALSAKKWKDAGFIPEVARFQNRYGDSAGECTAAHNPRRWSPAPQWVYIRSGRAFHLAVGKNDSGVFHSFATCSVRTIEDDF